MQTIPTLFKVPSGPQKPLPPVCQPNAAKDRSFRAYLNRLIPVCLSVVTAFASSGAAIAATGPIRTWGYERFGVTDVPEIQSKVTAVAGHYSHSLALKEDGTVVAWGANGDDFGQTKVPANLSNVAAIAAGFRFSLALKKDGTVVAWGDNYHGSLNVPAGLSNVTAIAAGYGHGLALKEDGTVVAWGSWSWIPANLSNVVQIATKGTASAALKSDGTVVAWHGSGQSGQAEAAVPAGLNNVIAITAGDMHFLALKADGTVVGWGYNGFGQTNVPEGLANVKAIAAGVYRSIALQHDGTLVVWGQPGSTTGSPPPPTLQNATALAAGSYHAIAVHNPVPPVADVPANQITIKEGQEVVLDGAASYHPLGAPISYTWRQTNNSGSVPSRPTLVNPNGSVATFTAPSVGTAGATLEYELTAEVDGLHIVLA